MNDETTKFQVTVKMSQVQILEDVSQTLGLGINRNAVLHFAMGFLIANHPDLKNLTWGEKPKRGGRREKGS